MNPEMDAAAAVKETNLKVGQIVSSIGRQITVPDWHGKWRGREEGFVRLADMPIIRLSHFMAPLHDASLSLPKSEYWIINTNKYRQSGLVCFVPERYLGMAILSVQVVAVGNKSVVAQPVEWIEVTPPASVAWIGNDSQEIFDVCMLDGEPRGEVRAIWHNKGEGRR